MSSQPARNRRPPQHSRGPLTREEQRRLRARQKAQRREAGRRTRRRTVLTVVVVLLCVVFVGLVGTLVYRMASGGTGGDQAVSADPVAAGEGSAVEEEPPAEDQPVEINLMMAGDILFHYQIRESGLQADGSRNFDHVFEHVLGELEGQDVKVVNQETPLGGAELGYSGFPTFNGPQEIGDAEVKAGFNVILKATNHAMDMGYAGVSNEQAFWKGRHPEVAVIGETDPNDPATSVDDVYVYEKDGFRVALLNYTYDLNGFEDPQGAVSMLTEEHVRATMAQAREMADMIVVFPHWGEEYMTFANEDQHAWANLFMEEGADLIIGGHPHVIEPVELLAGEDGKVVPCFWSVGNFISTSPSNESLVGGLAKATLRKDVDGTCSVVSASFVPVVTHLGLTTDMTTYLLSDWTDELAATNSLFTDINQQDATGLTRAWANEFCTGVLGPGFDAANERLDLPL